MSFNIFGFRFSSLFGCKFRGAYVLNFWCSHGIVSLYLGCNKFQCKIKPPQAFSVMEKHFNHNSTSARHLLTQSYFPERPLLFFLLFIQLQNTGMHRFRIIYHDFHIFKKLTFDAQNDKQNKPGREQHRKERERCRGFCRQQPGKQHIVSKYCLAFYLKKCFCVLKYLSREADHKEHGAAEKDPVLHQHAFQTRDQHCHNR